MISSDTDENDLGYLEIRLIQRQIHVGIQYISENLESDNEPMKIEMGL